MQRPQCCTADLVYGVSVAGPRAARRSVLAALSLLYAAQGIPFGIASEYLPVVFREAHYSMTAIASLGFLQAPWQAKVLWASIADRPAVRRRSREVLLAVQLALAATVVAYAAFSSGGSPTPWLVLTFFAALFAATQDIFVDAFAVRLLGPEDRGFGNTAQVAGYRLGILAGGAGLLLLSTRIGEGTTLVSAGGAIALTGAAAFVLRGDESVAAEPAAAVGAFGVLEDVRPDVAPCYPHGALRLGAHLVARDTWPVVAIALGFKLGLHMAGAVIKPMCVDAGWTRAQIGWAVVTVGLGASLAGAALGGFTHRALRERSALGVAIVVQAAACIPLFVAARMGVPLRVTTIAIASEHLASGFGTTILFAALMSATRPADAALHYTALTSINVLSIFLGSFAGGVLGDRLGPAATYVAGGVMSLAPLAALPRWDRAAAASRG